MVDPVDVCFRVNKDDVCFTVELTSTSFLSDSVCIKICSLVDLSGMKPAY